ncbi:MAG: transglutaminase domain-containing protein [Deltaproteobacteria bacterium]|nr:transglutaminase domain-containing protein [Deltaproteobacteria bacterium]
MAWGGGRGALRWFGPAVGCAWLSLTLGVGCGSEELDQVDPADGGVGGGETVLSETLRIEAGQAYVIRIEPSGTVTAEPAFVPYDWLSTTVAEAVDRAPDWVQEPLARTLVQLVDEDAVRLAAEIMAADDTLVDEVAWSIAVTDPAILHWILERGDEGLFVENAEGVYAVAAELAYATLVEQGDGRTTLELNGENGLFELEPEEYYWYVVYPRAYLELPAYESGQFWRTHFRQDTTYGSTVIDAVSGATTLQAAADGVGDWIQSFMEFGYGTNDLWPIEIYDVQFGSCGQYSILTTAAAKTALIPTVSVSARADDHEWNELWDGRWVMWDNSLGEIGNNPHYPYIDMPEVFDDDTAANGGTFGEIAHVFRYRGDEYIWPSDLYTPYRQVYVDVTDGWGLPVAGARVIAHSSESDYHPCAWAPTNQDGRASLVLGDDLGYGFSATHSLLGEAPANGQITATLYTTGITEEKFDTLVYETTLPRTLVDVGWPPPGELEIELTFRVTQTEQRVRNLITEGFELGQTYPQTLTGGLLDVYLVDDLGLEAAAAQAPFNAHPVALAAPEGQVQWTAATDGAWTLVLDNSWWPAGAKLVELDLTVRR